MLIWISTLIFIILDDVVISVNECNSLSINVENHLINIYLNKKNKLVRYSDTYKELSNDYNSFTNIYKNTKVRNTNNNKE